MSKNEITPVVTSDTLAQKLESIISGHSINEDDADWLRALIHRPQAYPLPGELYDSKDWRQGNYASRVEWLHTMYEHAKHERDEYAAQLEALRPQPVPMTREQI